MKKAILFLLLLAVASCKTKQKSTPSIQSIFGKIIDANYNGIPNAEFIAKDFQLILYTDNNGNFEIKNHNFIKELKDGINIIVEIRSTGYETKKFQINKLTHLESSKKLKFFVLNKIETIPEIKDKEIPEKVVVENKPVIIEKPKKETSVYTDVNIGEIENSGEIHIGSKEINNDNRTIYNETKIVHDTKIIEIPFEERDCAKKEIGYVTIKNNYDEGINLQLITYGPKKSPMAMRFETYTMPSKTTKILRLQSDYHYGINGEKFTEKWAGTFTYGFSDAIFVTPCDTQNIVIQ